MKPLPLHLPTRTPQPRRRALGVLATTALAALTPLLPLGGIAQAAEPDTSGTKTIKLLTVGNSFTNNAVRFLPGIVSEAPDCELLLGKAVVGGGPLEQHWRAVEAHEADAKDPKGRIYGGKSLKDKLQEQPWEFVTIQQNSYKSTDLSTYRPFAGNMAAYIRKYAPDAELIIHQTWAYRMDDVRFKGDDSQAKMYQDLTNSYLTIAEELSVVQIIPVGRAFQEARSHPEWQFTYPDPEFDYENPVFPALPNQAHSLNRGWFWSKEKKLQNDGHHANAAGEYLGAAVWFEHFFQEDVRGNAYTPDALDRKDVLFLQEIAHKVAAGQGKDRQINADFLLGR